MQILIRNHENVVSYGFTCGVIHWLLIHNSHYACVSVPCHQSRSVPAGLELEPTHVEVRFFTHFQWTLDQMHQQIWFFLSERALVQGERVHDVIKSSFEPLLQLQLKLHRIVATQSRMLLLHNLKCYVPPNRGKSDRLQSHGIAGT